MNFSLIYFKETGGKGRGVFSTAEIEDRAVIERCPVILISSAPERNLIACTSLANYVFKWITNEEIIAVALGYGSLYNHSSKNNAMYKMNKEENTLDIIALRTIKPGEEITINYVGSTGKDPVKWFEARGIQYLE
jgi:uncharacterized protein